ncbi:MAG: hypothetical protein AB1806_11615 [Acidobacteriota bacterium]
MKTTVMTLIVAGLAATAGAQIVAHEHQVRAAAERHAQAVLEQHLQVLTEVQPATVRVSIVPGPVTGAPYSAEAVSETVQTLADGNRILKRSVSRIYRDSKGRTRNETLTADGQVKSVVISDPAGRTSYQLVPEKNVAQRIGLGTVHATSAGRGAGAGIATTRPLTFTVVELKAAHEAELKRAQGTLQALKEAEHKTQQAATMVHEASGAERTSARDDLGVRSFDGVEARGSRTTTVIPAGAIGNVLPITITSEEWTSPELKVLVMTRHADPRTGETTYRLSGISRAEPDASLFEVPAGYTIK